jgi:hypothetical protein
MNDYPKQDHPITIITSDNSRISGMINVLGRSISVYLQGPEPDVIMYDCTIDDTRKADTLMVSKRQILWLNTGESLMEQRIGNWQTLMFHLVNGVKVKGDVNMTGYDRVSDFLQSYGDRFYEVFDAETVDSKSGMLYVSREHTVWKEPLKS